jgi:hypothetical protein
MGYLTVETNYLFQTIMEVQGGGGSSGGGGGDSGKIDLVNSYIERTPEDLDMMEILD